MARCWLRCRLPRCAGIDRIEGKQPVECASERLCACARGFKGNTSMRRSCRQCSTERSPPPNSLLPCHCQITAPELVGGHEYWVEQLPGRPHPCYLRRAVAPPGGQQAAAALPEVVLDVNELAAVHGEYVQVGQVNTHLWRTVGFRVPACWLAG